MVEKNEVQKNIENEKSTWDQLTDFFDALKYVFVDRKTGKDKITLIEESLANTWKSTTVANANQNKKKS